MCWEVEMKSITTSLMFVGDQAGKAEEAVKRYVSLFANSRLIDIEHYGADEHEPEGAVKIARFTIGGTEFLAMDSYLDHQFNFTPSISLRVECESEQEIEDAARVLAEGGAELMPLDNYGFSEKFGWLNDKYGVSWQLNFSAS
ncbi:VOC family protein [Alcanivorax sp. JB21]|nr:VOC family protein [Alcanivorax limicola]